MQHVFAEPHVDPARLDLGRVDDAMRPLVERINASGWVWTTESCAGDDIRPAVLGLATDQHGAMLSLLADAAIVHAGRVEKADPNTPRLVLAFYAPPKLARCLYHVRVQAPFSVLRTFAERA